MWNNVFPSLLIGLREGLGTGLAAAVLAALPARAGARERLGAVRTGVAAALALSLSAAAVLTYTSTGFPADGRAALDGVLSVLAVCLVTVLVFFPTRRGAGTLALAAFLAVGHEGLDTALYLWTTVKSAGQAHGQLLGAVLGILLAVVLCWGLYRGVRRNSQASVGVLIVLAAGMLAYGLGELQAAGWLPGHAAHAFDLSSIDAGSWYASLITGTLNLTPVMTWLQIAGYLVFLVATVVVLAYGTRAAAIEADADGGGLTTSPRAPRWTVYGAIIAVPALAAVATISVMGTANASSTSGTIQIAINETSCGTGWTSPTAGTHTFNVTDNGKSTAEVYLINPDSNTVYGEDPDVTPGSNEIMNVELAAGQYVFRCSFIDGTVLNSAVYNVTGSDHAPAGVAPVNEQDMELPVYEYRAYVETALPGLLTAAEKLDADLKAGNLAQARTDWLPAHLAYERLGAAYGTFDNFDD
jgi:high-affinity iron transporter